MNDTKGDLKSQQAFRAQVLEVLRRDRGDALPNRGSRPRIDIFLGKSA